MTTAAMIIARRRKTKIFTTIRNDAILVPGATLTSF